MDNKINIKHFDIVIPSLKNEYRFLQITDLHLYLSDSREANDRVRAYSWRYNHYWTVNGIKPEERLPLFLEYAKSNNLLPVFTGDMFDVPSKKNFEYFDECLKSVDKYIYTMGNHDWSYMDWLYKVNRYGKTPEKEDYHNKYTKQKYWHLFNKYAKNLYQEAFIYDDLIVATMYTGDEQYKKCHIGFLKNLYKLNKPIILFTHTPFYAVEDSDFAASTSSFKCDIRIGSKGRTIPGYIDTKYSQEIYKLVTQKDSPIKAIFAGHKHFESFGHLINGIPQYTAMGSYFGTAYEFIIKGDK